MTEKKTGAAKKRTSNDDLLFDQDIGYEYCPRCWVEKGWLIKLFIDDGYPVATMACPRCNFSHSFDVTTL